MERGETRAHFSLPSIIAIVAAIASFFVGAMGGFILALIAIGFGILGLVLSFSPSVRGGLVSVVSLVLAAIATFAAVIKAVTWAF